MSRVEMQAFFGCWLWTGAKTNGYGDLWDGVEGRSKRAHRLAYAFFRGPLTDGLELDHVVCDTPACVNPWHVEERTHAENIMRADNPFTRNARKTHCHRGHPFDDENTYLRKDGSRMCRECDRAHTRAWQEKQKARCG